VAEKTVYLGLGSNVGDREQNLRTALGLLEEAGVHVQRTSSLYETEPMYVRDQPWFLNMVAEVCTELMPVQLLGRLQEIERQLGRKRGHRGASASKGPRTLDLDILFYGRFIVTTSQLEVPHPRIEERRFVLEPLVELAPELRHPVSRRSMRELLAEVTGQQVRRVGPLTE
jgi:2-amino-4-hydroxy-6-hydroxymethyldihydropteridine diphosphokinase